MAQNSKNTNDFTNPCPICDRPLREIYRDVSDGTLFELQETCDEGHYTSYFAYGNTTIHLGGVPNSPIATGMEITYSYHTNQQEQQLTSHRLQRSIRKMRKILGTKERPRRD